MLHCMYVTLNHINCAFNFNLLMCILALCWVIIIINKTLQQLKEQRQVNINNMKICNNTDI